MKSRDNLQKQDQTETPISTPHPGGDHNPERKLSVRQQYVQFAKKYPKMNNLITASLKTCLADLIIQLFLDNKTLSTLNWKRTFIFLLYGGLYKGCFQYFYQVSIFSKLFPGIAKYTSQSWAAKLKDWPGFKSLVA